MSEATTPLTTVLKHKVGKFWDRNENKFITGLQGGSMGATVAAFAGLWGFIPNTATTFMIAGSTLAVGIATPFVAEAIADTLDTWHRLRNKTKSAKDKSADWANKPVDHSLSADLSFGFLPNVLSNANIGPALKPAIPEDDGFTADDLSLLKKNPHLLKTEYFPATTPTSSTNRT